MPWNEHVNNKEVLNQMETKVSLILKNRKRQLTLLDNINEEIVLGKFDSHGTDWRQEERKKWMAEQYLG